MKKRATQKTAQNTLKKLIQKAGPVKACLFALLIAISTLVSAITVFIPQTANAAPNGVYVDQDLMSNIEAYAYRNAIARCFQGSWELNSNNTSDVADGKWFGDTSQIAVTHMLSADDAKFACTNASDMVTAAMHAFGWSTNTEAACALGVVKRSNKSDCVNGSGGYDYVVIDKNEPDSLYKKIDDKRFNGHADFTDAMYYLLYARSMELGCRAHPIIEYDKANADQKNRAQGDDNMWAMKVVNSDGTITNTIYQSGSDYGRGRDITTTVSPNTLDNQSKSCIDLVRAANQYADAYAKYVKANPPSSTDNSNGNSDNSNNGNSGSKTTCVINGIGWILCPVVNFMAQVVDAAQQLVSAMLQVQPLVSTGNNGEAGVYQAWSIMRNFANVAFVIAFLIIIFSQLTSVGISNYGIKKMLPRLVIAAILVNVSYWICAIAVDLSNILGASLNNLFQAIANGIKGTDATGINSGKGWVGIAGGLLAGATIAAGVLYVGLSALLPVLLTVLLAILTVFITLTLRQALIILLIVISPLAFVAYLLPNTENLFKKWRELLQTLLLMYPIIGLLFGASALASKIVMNTAPAGNGDLGKAIQIAIQIMGAGISIIPLILTPILIRTTKGILGRVGAYVNNPNRGPIDRLRKGAEGYGQSRKELRQLRGLNGNRQMPLRGAFIRGGARREAVLSNRKTELNRANASYIAERAEANEGFRGTLARGGGEGADMRALAAAINMKAELQTKEVKAASAVIEHLNLSSGQLNDLAKGGEVAKDGRTLSGTDDATRKAAIASAVATGTVSDVEEVIKSAGSMSSEQQKTLAGAIASSSIPGKATHLSGQSLDDIAQGKVTSEEDLDRITARTVQKGKYSAEKLAENDKSSLERIGKVLQQAKDGARADIDTAQLDDVQKQAERALTDTRISGRITEAQRGPISTIQTL